MHQQACAAVTSGMVHTHTCHEHSALSVQLHVLFVAGEIHALEFPYFMSNQDCLTASAGLGMLMLWVLQTAQGQPETTDTLPIASDAVLCGHNRRHNRAGCV